MANFLYNLLGNIGLVRRPSVSYDEAYEMLQRIEREQQGTLRDLGNKTYGSLASEFSRLEEQQQTRLYESEREVETECNDLCALLESLGK
jgi:DNA-directed RNA polymerase subunit F